MRPTKSDHRQSRRRRIRARITGTPVRPRLAVFCSLTTIYAQLIDDTAGKTLVYVSGKEAKAKSKTIADATKIGNMLATKAKAAKITAAVFDRAGRKYHGRIKALADAARAGGLQF